MEKSIVNEVVSTLEAIKGYGQPGLWILLASILIVLVLVIAAVVYRRIVIKRSQTLSKATQENFEAIAADLRKRALEVKNQDEGLKETRAGGEGAQATTGAEEITTGAEGERQSHYAPARFQRDDDSSS
jgi:hypothetical protein